MGAGPRHQPALPAGAAPVRRRGAQGRRSTSRPFRSRSSPTSAPTTPPGPTAARRSPGPSARASSACRSTRSSSRRSRAEDGEKDEDKDKAEAEKKEQKPKPEEMAVVVERPRHRPRGTIVLRGAKVITMRGDEVIADGDIVVTDHRIAAVGPQGIGQGARGGQGHRRRRDDDRARLRRHPRPLDGDPPRRARHAELELLRQPRLRRDHRPRPADRHQRHVRLSGPGRDRRAGRPAGLLDRARRLLRHRLPVGRGGRRRRRPVQEVLPHEHAEVVHDRQPPAAAVDDRGLPQEPGDADDRGRPRPEAEPDARPRRLQRQRAQPAGGPALRRRGRAVRAARGSRTRRRLLVAYGGPFGETVFLHDDGDSRRPQDPPVHPARDPRRQGQALGVVSQGRTCLSR